MTRLALAYFAVGAVAFTAGLWLDISDAMWLTTVAGVAAADLLWAVDAIDRSGEREPMPLTFIPIFWDFFFIPGVALRIALGVAARKGVGRLRRPGPLRGATG